ncbi:MAG: hypothetical protein ABI972_00005 [Acidobacteriota bacterium]
MRLDGENLDTKICEFVDSGDHLPHIAAKATDLPDEHAPELSRRGIPPKAGEHWPCLSATLPTSALFNINGKPCQARRDLGIYPICDPASILFRRTILDYYYLRQHAADAQPVSIGIAVLGNGHEILELVLSSLLVAGDPKV